MIDSNINIFEQEKKCTYKNEIYSVRDNGAVMRHTKGKERKRKYDNIWTFGTTINEKGYPCIASEVIHRIVATAFLGEAPSKSHVVDHINTNRQDNRPSNLRWVTRLENIFLNPITCKKIEKLTGLSIENVLSNIEILHKYTLPPNIAWMRNVSQKESESCLENLTRWAKTKSYPNNPYNGSLGEWIYQNRKQIIKYEYHRESEDNQIKKSDISLSLTKNAAQDTTRWKTLSEFPNCPSEISSTPLESYLEKLQSGVIFCKNKKFKSLVVETVLYKNMIIVKTKNEDENTVKPWAISTVIFDNNLFVHTIYNTYFEEIGADKYFSILQD